MNNVERLASEWLAAKEHERQIVEKRRSIEDELIKHYHIAESMEGAESRDAGDYKIKMVGRLTRKIDSEKLQELANENGLTEHLSSLFRWKPEINMTAWKAADEAVVRQLMGAITTAPSRPSFTITSTANKE